MKIALEMSLYTVTNNCDLKGDVLHFSNRNTIISLDTAFIRNLEFYMMVH